MASKLVHEWEPLLTLVPDDPRSAVDMHEHGSARWRRGAAANDVEPVAGHGVAHVVDVLDHGD